jgi:hypothetical protein
MEELTRAKCFAFLRTTLTHEAHSAPDHHNKVQFGSQQASARNVMSAKLSADPRAQALSGIDPAVQAAGSLLPGSWIASRVATYARLCGR